MDRLGPAYPGLELLARAIAGRDVEVISTASGSAHTDGNAIYVDEAAHEDEDEVLRREVMVQAALLGVGSLDRSVLPKLVRNPEAARRYLTLEVARACHELRWVLPRDLVSAASAAHAGRLSSGPAESLSRAAGTEHITEPPEWFGVLRPLKALRHGRSRESQVPTDADLAQLRRGVSSELEELDECQEESAERSRIMELLSSPLRNPLGTALQKMLGMGRSADEGKGGGEIGSVGRSATKLGSRGRAVSGLPAQFVEMGGHLVRGATYPEWNWTKNRYREQWCTVGMFDPPPPDEQTASLRNPGHPLLERRIAELGLIWRTHRGQTAGDDLDLSALVEHHVARAAGKAGDAHVYEQRRHTAHDLGVLILLDATGSSAETTDGGEVYEDQRKLADALAAAFERVGVRVALHAFYSRGRGNVRYLRCLDFDGRYDAAARRRLASIRPGGFTRLGAALRHGTEMLATHSGSQQMLLIVIGDGFAYDDGYEDRYALEDSRRAVREAAQRGIGCVSLSVRPPEDPDRLVWEPGRHGVARTPSELAPQVRDLLGAAVRQAGLTQRRTGSTRSRVPSPAAPREGATK